MENIDFRSKDINELILAFGDIIFPALTDMINLIFGARNKDFKKFDQAFVEDNIGNLEIKNLCILLIEQNQLSSLLPFFQDFIRKIFDGLMTREMEIAIEKAAKEQEKTKTTKKKD